MASGASSSGDEQWGRTRAGKLVRRYVSEQQAQILRPAIANYRAVKALLRQWEDDTERLIDTEPPRPR